MISARFLESKQAAARKLTRSFALRSHFQAVAPGKGARDV
jgi:hypothetical protein